MAGKSRIRATTSAQPALRWLVPRLMPPSADDDGDRESVPEFDECHCETARGAADYDVSAF